MSSTDVVVTLVHIECGGCGTVFGMSEDLYRRRKADHENFWCPRGCRRHFVGRSEAEKLRDELTRERARLDQERARSETLQRRLTVRDRQVAARKAVATKLRKRIAAGKCPCCHAQFKDLKQHMKTRHPHWNPEQAAEAIAARDATP